MRAVLCVVWATVSSCNYTSLEDIDPQGCVTDQVIWSVHVAPIISTRCAISGCHVGNAPIGDFTTPEGVLAKVNSGAFAFRVLDTRLMPPNGPLDSCRYHVLRRWVGQGAPIDQ